MAKDFEMGYLLDFYGEVLTPKQREMLRQYYNDDLSLSEIGENFGITRQGARDAIKHGETALKELEEKVGFAARYRRVQQTLEELEQLVIDARFECTGPNARLTTTEASARSRTARPRNSTPCAVRSASGKDRFRAACNRSCRRHRPPDRDACHFSGL